MRACAIEMHFNISQALFTKNCRKNAADQNEPRTQTNILCEPARSKHMPRFHKNRFIQKFTRKMLQPRVRTLIKHRSLPGLYTYRKNPSVWTHCLGNFVHVAGAWPDMSKTNSAVCTLDHEKGVSSYAASYNVFACCVPRSKQLCAGISYSVSWFMRETIARKTLCVQTTYRADDSGNRRREHMTREDEK